MTSILFDDPTIRAGLLPLTFTRPVGAIRVGIVPIAEKWRHFLQSPVYFLTEPYLHIKYPLAAAGEALYINGGICPDDAIASETMRLKMGESLVQNDTLLAFRTDQPITQPAELIAAAANARVTTYANECCLLRRPYHIFMNNGAQIKSDFAWLTQSRESAPITDPYTRTYRADQIFVEDGARILASVLNAESGPIYVGKNAEIQEGCVIRGSFALGEDSMLNMGSKMRGDITIGPMCKVGGEMSNSVVFGYSNKAHEGYMGNSVMGEWCNLGADTNTSNMKNDYGNVKLWSYLENELVDTGRQFCGLMMGDHSKAGINTMFNTGTVVGVSANLFGSDFPPKHVPSFAWGNATGFSVFRLDKALEVADRAMQRRNFSLSDADRQILTHVFNQTHASVRRIGFV